MQRIVGNNPCHVGHLVGRLPNDWGGDLVANGWINATVSLLNCALHLAFIEKPAPPPLVGGGRGEGVLGGALYNLDDRIRAAHGRQNYAVKAL